MRKVRFNVAASLDGYIADPGGGYDWIPHDPAVDFAALFAGVDTVLLGRRSYEIARGEPATPWPADARVYVFSRTLDPGDHPEVTVVGDDAAETVAALRAEPGTGDIWLFGGGRLFGSLLAAGQVDVVEVTLVPVLLGGGVPLLPPGAPRTALALTHSRVYPSGMLAVHYEVCGGAAENPGAGCATPLG
jgi:dihydrofolate reductase